MEDINNINLYSLKNILRTDISLYEDKKKEEDNNSYLISIYNEILSIIGNLDAKEIMENSLSLNLLLSLIYGNELANTIHKNIYKTSYLISEYSKSEYYEDELLKAKDKLNKLVRRIMDEYEILYNKNKIYTNELNNLSNKVYIEKGILYRLNVKKFLSKFHIEEIKKILKENNWSNDKQIIILEYIRNHNIKCNFNNPKTSYATINMLKTNFTLYNTDELMNLDSKRKLDSHVNAMYETLSCEDDKDIDAFVSSYTNWMNKEDYDYTMQCLLNKFINDLKNCQKEMVQNYDDIDLRKIIIEDYHYYSKKHEEFKNYYEEKTNVTLEENILPEENLEPIEENNLFFAMASDSSYIEKDIEDVPEEYLDRIKKLLEGFKNNNLQEKYIEGFSSNEKLRGFKKLKDDQVRIVFKKINNNNYLILGIMIKKQDKATKEYLNLVKRNNNYSIDDEIEYINKLNESNEIYNNLMEYIENNSRKGNR